MDALGGIVGFRVGSSVGSLVGDNDGLFDGCSEGFVEGMGVGFADGDLVGSVGSISQKFNHANSGRNKVSTVNIRNDG